MADDTGPVDDYVGPLVVAPSLIVNAIQASHLSAAVGEKRVADPEGLGELLVRFGGIPADPQDLGIGVDEVTRLLPEPGQLFCSARGKGPNVEGQHHVLLPYEVAEADHATSVIWQREIRGPAADLDGLSDDREADKPQQDAEAQDRTSAHCSLLRDHAFRLRQIEAIDGRASPVSLYAVATST